MSTIINNISKVKNMQVEKQITYTLTVKDKINIALKLLAEIAELLKQEGDKNCEQKLDSDIRRNNN